MGNIASNGGMGILLLTVVWGILLLTVEWGGVASNGSMGILLLTVVWGYCFQRWYGGYYF